MRDERGNDQGRGDRYARAEFEAAAGSRLEPQKAGDQQELQGGRRGDAWWGRPRDQRHPRPIKHSQRLVVEECRQRLSWVAYQDVKKRAAQHGFVLGSVESGIDLRRRPGLVHRVGPPDAMPVSIDQVRLYSLGYLRAGVALDHPGERPFRADAITHERAMPDGTSQPPGVGLVAEGERDDGVQGDYQPGERQEKNDGGALYRAVS